LTNPPPCPKHSAVRGSNFTKEPSPLRCIQFAMPDFCNCLLFDSMYLPTSQY
jgi:hypothetical protein